MPVAFGRRVGAPLQFEIALKYLCQMPRNLLKDDLDAGRLVEVLQAFEPEPVDVHAVWPNVSHLRPKVRYVVDELVRLCQDCP